MAVNKDFYSDLPGSVCATLDRLIKQYKDQPWFEEAWNKYRQHVKKSTMDDMKMPGFIFNKYTKKLNHSMLFDDTSVFKIADSYELYHHGILGMKWGVRRYQNPDGSLTAEGKLRYRMGPDGKYVKLTHKERKAAKKKAEQLEKARKAAEAAKKNKSPREKKITEMTDKQLEKYIKRMQLEKDAIDIRNKVNELDPKPLSKGEKFTKYMLNKVVEPMVQDAGKKFLDAAIKKAFEDKKEEAKPDKYAEAKRDADYWNNLKNIENNKADYNKTKAKNDEFNKTKNTDVYNNNKNNKNNNNSNRTEMTDKQKTRASQMFDEGKTVDQIAKQFNMPVDAVSKYFFSGYKDK